MSCTATRHSLTSGCLLDLPPYIRALKTPLQSPRMRLQSSMVPGSIDGAADASRRPDNLDFHSNSSLHQLGDIDLSDAFSSLNENPNPIYFHNSGQNQANDGSWESLPANNIITFSPEHRLFMPTPSGRDTEAART